VETLGVERIDHGVTCLADPSVVALLRDRQVPLTVCPISNLKLKVVGSLADHPLGRLLDAGLLVTVNSDDPSYFGGYLNDNHRRVRDALSLPDATLITLARNSFQAAFLPDTAKAHWQAETTRAAAPR
jgi:adenosine deaminase